MPLRFPYLPLPTQRPVCPLGGISVRNVPACQTRIIGTGGDRLLDCRFDSGADDTVFPEWVAQRIGIDLANAPWGESRPVGGSPVRYRYATVTLYLTDQIESCEWKAIVGFLNVPNLRWGFLGVTGFLQFFDMSLFGSRHETVLTPNTAFTGRYRTP